METMLITGGAGSVGSFLIERFHKQYKVVALDNSDYDLWRLQRRYPGIKIVLGDVRNQRDISYPIRESSIIIHCAAYKNLEITENNAAATCDNDFMGTVKILYEIEKYSNKRFILISTDKAVYPISCMGAAKMLAEKITLEKAINDSGNIFAIARFVNVEETRGNVFELWREQQKYGLPFEITDVRMVRHFNTVKRVQQFFVDIIPIIKNGQIFIPDVPKSKVIDRFHEIYGDAPYIEVGIRKNEKLYDPLATDEEVQRIITKDGYFIIDYSKF